jgi:hypothetical protein
MVNYPSTTERRPVDTDTIDSFQRRTAGEPCTPYRIKAPPLRTEEAELPTKTN